MPNLSLNPNHTLKEKLLSGDFSLMLECVLPPHASECPEHLTTLATQLSTEAHAWDGVVLSCRDPQASAGEIADVLPLAAKAAAQLPIIPVYSGRGQCTADAILFARQLQECGATTVLTVSGDLHTNAPPVSHLDSVKALEVFETQSNGELLCGAVISPAQYHHLDSTMIYDKMARKLAAGARFLVMSTLWDMKKAQELQWYLRLHNFAVPVFAQTEYFSPDTLEYYLHGEVHRALVSGAMLRQMRANLKESPEAFQRDQFQRLARQVVGFRLLGFSGVIILGLDTAALREGFRQELSAFSAQCNDYNQWLEAWKADECTGALPPLQTTDYLYRDLLEPNCQYETADDMRVTPIWHGQAPKAPLSDRALRLLRRALDHDRVPQNIKHLAGMTNLNIETLRQTGYIDNHACPKQLTCGACSGLQPNGKCEDGIHPCFFRRLLGNL